MPLLTDDGELIVAGMKEATPVIPEGDTIKHVSGGTRHFTLVTEQGRVYAWGQNFRKQCEVPADLQEAGAVDTVFSSGFQNYAFKDGKFVEAWGLKGYVFGTDDYGVVTCSTAHHERRQDDHDHRCGRRYRLHHHRYHRGLYLRLLRRLGGHPADARHRDRSAQFRSCPSRWFCPLILQSSDLHENTRIFIIMLILGLLSWTGLAKPDPRSDSGRAGKGVSSPPPSAMGVKEGRIAFKHILPNVISVILVSADAGLCRPVC